ncbi:MAG: Flp pilus assembly protein CpaB [Chloroflexi bacterium]|nr:Flp pilus assembly protein CpaB [Chloroflexota bacterium]
MAQTMTAASIGRVNRRFLFLALILAALSAVLVYPLLTRSSDSGGGAAVGIPVVVARANINAGQTITAELLEVQQIPETVVGALAFSEIDAVTGEIARYPIVVGEQVLVSKIVGSSISVSDTTISNFIESGKRAMAIRTDPILSAGGLVLPGDYVDVYWVPDSSPVDIEGAVLIGENIEVLAVDQTIIQILPTAPGLQQEEGEEGAATAGAGDRIQGLDGVPIPTAITVTLMVTPEEVERIFCGEEGGELRLAVRAFGDHSPSSSQLSSCTILGTDR